MPGPRVLAIETSCDETGVAVVVGGRRIESNQVASQIAIHAQTGGIVPEVAARQQLRWIVPATEAALREAGVARVYTPKDFDLNRIMGEIAELVTERAEATTSQPA